MAMNIMNLRLPELYGENMFDWNQRVLEGMQDRWKGLNHGEEGPSSLKVHPMQLLGQAAETFLSWWKERYPF